MILILDTDTLTVLQRRTEPDHSRLRARLEAFPHEDVRTTVVSFEEQMRGWLSAIAGSKNEVQELAAYERLYNLLMFFSSIPVLGYDDDAAKHFAALRRLRLRVGSMDLRIAAITLSESGLLLTRNLKDFSRVPNLRVEDWTV
jgi:tRNA(fMet)-specific endonuclease VapC